jgi:hypothetical protein
VLIHVSRVIKAISTTHLSLIITAAVIAAGTVLRRAGRSSTLWKNFKSFFLSCFVWKSSEETNLTDEEEKQGKTFRATTKKNL